MKISDIFDTEFDLGATSTEPTIRRMIEAYYVDRGIDIARAKELANELITVALAKVNDANNARLCATLTSIKSEAKRGQDGGATATLGALANIWMIADKAMK